MYKSDICRVVIIGSGRVGSHCAMSLIPGHIADEIVLIDVDKGFVRAQADDLSDFAAGMGSAVTVRAGDYSDCDAASFVIVAAGRGRRPGETRLQLLHDTLGVLRDVSNRLHSTAFDGMLICVTNPVDVATEYLCRSLELPSCQIVGTGTSLDTIRLKRMLSRLTGIDIGQIQGFCLGEHGDSSFIAWSHVSLGGVPLSEFVSSRPELRERVDTDAIQRLVHDAGGHIISGKGCTEFGVGSVVTDLIWAISHDEKRMLPLSARLSGQYGQSEICIGTLCMVGGRGLERVFEIDLNDTEYALMTRSCDIIRDRVNETRDLQWT